MNILILNWMDIKNPSVGGAEIILYELSKRLVADGHQVTCFARSFPGAKPREIIDGVEIIRRGNKYSVYFDAYKYYRSLKVKPDKVMESINTICWQTPLYVPKEKRIAYINQLAKEVLLYQLPFYLAYPAFILEPLQYLLYKDTPFLCYSQSVRQDLTTVGIPLSNIKTFPMGLDQARYGVGVKSENPLFVFVARFVRMKRADICIEAMKQVVNRYPKAQLALVGYGPQERSLQKQIQKAGLQNNVFIINKNNLFFKKNMKDMKLRYLQSAWALLLPSVKEGWGMVVTEAASCGTPAIVSNVTGLVDSVLPEKTGLILSSSPTSEELSQAMLRLIADSSFRKRLSNGAKLWSRHFNWEECYKVFLAHIKK